MSAREATRKLVSATKQMHALQAVLQDMHGEDQSAHQQPGDTKVLGLSSDENANTVAEQAGPWAAKNTIVKDVLRELTNASRHSRKRLQSSSRVHK